MTLGVLLVYMGLVLFIGFYSHRLFRPTGESYFVADRSIGPFVLLMSLFGTNMTAFAILGASAEAYRTGIATFGKMASISAIIVPCVYFFIGTRLWSLGKRNGYVTQVQFFRERWGSNKIGLLLFVVLVALLVPYILIGVMAGGVILEQVTGGAAPPWAGNLAITLVVLAYVLYSGMRGTAWVNTFQTLVFMVFGVATLFIVLHDMGGLGAAMQSLQEARPDLLSRTQHIRPMTFLSYTCVPLSVGMFPHLFAHFLTARRASTFRFTVTLFPLCIAFVWIPMVLLGMLGNLDFPGLQGPAAGSVLLQMIDLHAPTFLVGFLAAGVFAASMSSLDSQVLSLGTMFSHDIVRHYGFHNRMSEKGVILTGRLFIAAILLLAFVLSLFTNRSIFGLGVWSFTGFASLFPVVVAALFWKRSTKWGAAASVLSVAALWIYFFIRSGGASDYSVGSTGILPVAVMLAVSSAVMVVVSVLTPPPGRDVLRKFFPDEGVAVEP
jgi:SSS family solute:Na+ symporter